MTDSAAPTPQQVPTSPNGRIPVVNPVPVAPALVGMAIDASWRITRWSTDTAVRAGGRIVRAAMGGASPARLVDTTQAELRVYLRRMLGVGDSSIVEAPPPRAGMSNGDLPGGRAELRALGDDLLRRSAQVDVTEELHPAYARILSDIAPDEARILRLLWYAGPEPAVDVRTAVVFGVGSQLVAPGLSMIGMRAGCRHVERVPAYLNNLHRLGLVWFSREPVTDTRRYQLLEVQPDVMEAKRRAGRGRTKRRSIHLTPFGKDFCDSCLPPPPAGTTRPEDDAWDPEPLPDETV